MASRAVVALLPSSKPSTISTGWPSTPPAALISVGGRVGGVDQRLPDRGALAGLGQQQPDPQHAVVGARPATVVVVTAVARLVGRRRPVVVAGRADDAERHDDRRPPRVVTGGERALDHDRAAVDPLPFADALDRGLAARRADRRRARSAVGSSCRALSDATDELLVGPVRRRRRQGRHPAAQVGRRPRRRRRVRPPGAGPAQRRRRPARLRRQAGRDRGAGQGPLVPAVGRRPEARPRRALASTTSCRWPATTSTRRRRCSAPARWPATTSSAPGSSPRACRGGAATAAAGSTPCGRGSSSAGPRPATSPTCSSPTSRTATAGCATCTRCGGRPTPT